MKCTFEFKLKESRGFDSYKGNIRGPYIQAPFAALEDMFTKLPESVSFDIEISKSTPPAPSKQTDTRSVAAAKYICLSRIPNALRSPRLENGNLRRGSQSPSRQHPLLRLPPRQEPNHLLLLLQPRSLHPTLPQTAHLPRLLSHRIRPHPIRRRARGQSPRSYLVRQELAPGGRHQQV